MPKALKPALILIIGAFLFYLYFIDSTKETAEKHGPQVLQSETEERVLNAAQTLPHKGVLQESMGFVYLHVDDRYIEGLFPLIQNRKYFKPPYFRQPDGVGAHISVFYTNETERIGRINEIGQEYSFKITDLTYVPPRYRDYIVIEVSSPELEQLRQKYGLSPLLKGHQFHITIAKKRW
jgi:hypothetical protein